MRAVLPWLILLPAGCVEDSLRPDPGDSADDTGSVDTDDTDGPVAVLDVDLFDIDAGSWLDGCASLPQTRRIRNPGEVDATFGEVQVTGEDAAAFSVTAPTDVPAGGQDLLSVRFTPQGSGPATAEIVLPYNGGLLSWVVTGRGDDEVVWTDSRWMLEVSALDLVVVADTTASASDERRDSYPSLFNEVVAGADRLDLDWRLGVTTTSMATVDDGEGTGGDFAGEVTTEDTDTLAAVDDALQALPVTTQVRPFDAAVASVGTANDGFRRDDTRLGVLILAHDDDDSDRSPTATLSELGSYAQVSAVVSDPVLPCVSTDQSFGDNATRAPRIRDLVEDSGGRRADWCGPQASAVQLALEWPIRATGTPQSFEPAQTPRNRPVGKDIRDVTVDGVAVPEGVTEGWSWSSTRQAIELHGTWLAQPGDRVDLTYALVADEVCGGG